MRQDGKLSNEAVLEKAQQVAFEAFNWGVPTTEQAGAPNARAVEPARRNAAASAAPPVPVGGASNRVTAGQIDASNLNRDDWAKLTAQQKDELLA